MPIQDELERFRLRYPSTRVTVHDDYMIYKTAAGTAKRASIDANEVILDLGLSLVAKPTNLYKLDSFIVQEKR